MDKPLVSILIPAYNVEEYISQCLDSVINQTYKNLQIIIVDDGSKDFTSRICDNYAAEDERVEVYHIPNGGVANARNILLTKIKGDYFLFVDSDDWIELDAVELLIEKMTQHDADIVGYDSVKSIVLSESLRLQEDLIERDTIINIFLKHNTFNGSLWNKFIKSSLIKDNRFRNEISYGEDALFCWQLIQNVNRVLITNISKYHHRIHEESLSHKSWSPEGKGSGKIVWDIIREDVINKYPAHISLVNARCALMYMWDLLFASRSNYPKDEHIKERQKFINSHIYDLTRYRLAGIKQYLTALVLGRWYGAGKIISRFM